MFQRGACPILLGVSLEEFGSRTVLLSCIEQSNVSNRQYLIAILSPDSKPRVGIVLHRNASPRDALEAWFHGELLRQKYLSASTSGTPC